MKLIKKLFSPMYTSKDCKRFCIWRTDDAKYGFKWRDDYGTLCIRLGSWGYVKIGDDLPLWYEFYSWRWI